MATRFGVGSVYMMQLTKRAGTQPSIRTGYQTGERRRTLCGKRDGPQALTERGATRRFALAQLSLPRDAFPNLVESAEETAEIWLTDPDHWWRNTVDLITFGLERMLQRSRDGSQQQESTS